MHRVNDWQIGPTMHLPDRNTYDPSRYPPLVSNTHHILSVGVTLNGTGTSDITQQILKMDFKPYSANYFKPGLPYYGKVGDHASSPSPVYCTHSWLSIFTVASVV